MELSPWMKLVVAGAGFASDAYDLFAINLVERILEAIYPAPPGAQGALATAALAGAVVGQLVFSFLADNLGRRPIFITTISCVIVGAFLSTVAFDHPNFSIYTQLSLCQFLMGFGVGGEYPLSATVTSEGSEKEDRGTRLGLVFSMQGVGNLMAALMGWAVIGMTQAHWISADISWRIALGFGGVPGLLIVYWRWKMEETHAFQEQAASDHRKEAAEEDAALGASGAAGGGLVVNGSAGHGAEHSQESYVARACRKTGQAFAAVGHTIWNHSGQLAGTALSWFIFDVTFYGNGLFSSLVLEAAGVGAVEGNSAIENLSLVARGTVIVAALGLPGYVLAITTIDRFGRRPLQMMGFIMVGVVFLIIGLALKPLESHLQWLFIILYGLTFLFANWGPNTTTYVIPSELYPTRARATCHGISAASGKLGAVVGGLSLPPLLKDTDLATVLYVCAAVSVSGAIWTWAFVEDKSGQELEDDHDDADHPYVPPPPHKGSAPMLDWLRSFYGTSAPKHASGDSTDSEPLLSSP